jgi:hypothetical protein
MNVADRYCDDCGEVRVFVTPPCDDGHGADCPDVCCSHCGSALTGTIWLLTEDVVLVTAAHAA